MQTTEDRQRYNVSVFRWIHCPGYRTVFVQTDVRSSRVVVAVGVFFEYPNEMSLIENNAVVQTLAAKTADRSLSVRILPGTFPGGNHFLDAHRLYAFVEI